MKRFILLLLFVLSTTYIFAQSKTQLKGPRYKNYKPKRTTQTYAVSQRLKGPKAKNYKAKNTRSIRHAYRVAIGQERQRIGKHRKLNVGTTYRRSRK